MSNLMSDDKRIIRSGRTASSGSRQKMTITRSELANAVYNVANTSRREAAALVDVFLATIVERLVAGETMKIHGFGKFEVHAKGERPGRNPRTSTPVTVTARRVVRFQPTGKLRERVK